MSGLDLGQAAVRSWRGRACQLGCSSCHLIGSPSSSLPCLHPFCLCCLQLGSARVLEKCTKDQLGAWARGALSARMRFDPNLAT